MGRCRRSLGEVKASLGEQTATSQTAAGSQTAVPSHLNFAAGKVKGKRRQPISGPGGRAPPPPPAHAPTLGLGGAERWGAGPEFGVSRRRAPSDRVRSLSTAAGAALESGSRRPGPRSLELSSLLAACQRPVARLLRACAAATRGRRLAHVSV